MILKKGEGRLPRRKRLIAFDFDGVIANTYPVLREGFFNLYGIDIHPCHTYSILDKLGFDDRDKFYNDVRKILSNYSQITNPYPKSIEFLEEVYNKTRNPILIVTARDCSLSESTHGWLLKNLTVPYELFMVDEDWKKYYLLYRGVRYWCEDRLQQANHIGQGRVKVFLMNRIWNMGRNTNENTIRVNDFEEVFKLLLDEGVLCDNTIFQENICKGNNQ